MIISASRRTDIPSYYTEWFLNRIKEKYVYVRNPMNIHQISRIDLSPAVVDGMVIWTKNPVPLMGRLRELDVYPYYFQVTLTPYGKDIEANLPSKNHVLIPAFCDLSRQIGRERVVWRYDPVLFSNVYTMAYHKKHFRVLAGKLGAYTETCTVSFLDLYRNIRKNIRLYGIRVPTREEQLELLEEFSKIAGEYGFSVNTCAEEGDFSHLGIEHAHCIDQERLERIGKYRLKVKKDTNQRAHCGCVSSIDIGTYDSCKNGCVYCYGNHSQKLLREQTQYHDVKSPLLFGTVGENDVIKERKMMSLRQQQ